MQMVQLGRTGLQVSRLALGGIFTSSLGPGFEESKKLVFQALDAGINYIDTAPAYANSEEVLGKILKEVRTPIIFSTKLGGRPRPFDPKNPQQLRQSVTESLKLLNREVIDILLIHEPDRPRQYPWWNSVDPLQGPVLDVLNDLKKQGLIRFTGLGGTTSTEMAHLVKTNLFDVVLTAFNFSLLYREASREILPMAQKHQMGIVLGSVLQQGALGGRFDEVVRRKPIWLSESRRQQFLALYQFLDESGLEIVEASLRWTISRPETQTLLIGAKTAAHLETSVKAIAQGPLSNDQLTRLDEIAQMVPNRPFEEPMILPMEQPDSYWGPGPANLATGVPVGQGL